MDRPEVVKSQSMNESRTTPARPDPPRWLPPPYLTRLQERVKAEQPREWQAWQSESGERAAQDSLDWDLRESASPLARDSSPDLYRLAEQAAAALHLDVPISLYQTRHREGLGLSICGGRELARLVLQGEPREHLSDSECLAVFGHQLSYLLLWNIQDGDFLVAAKVLNALSEASPSHAVWQASHRSFQLFSQVYCDRGALQVCPQMDAVVSGLQKMELRCRFGLTPDGWQHGEASGVENGGSHPGPNKSALLEKRLHALRMWDSARATAELDIQLSLLGDLSLQELDCCRLQDARHVDPCPAAADSATGLDAQPSHTGSCTVVF